MIIAIDFDGAIVDHAFPEIGKLKPQAADVIRELKLLGHQLILCTCRNDSDEKLGGRKVLTEAIEFCKANGIEFDSINENIPGLYQLRFADPGLFRRICQA